MEQTIPYVFLREIPNKPPPPYVPPAHGSAILQAITTIFPSEDRLKELVFRKISELFTNLPTQQIQSKQHLITSMRRSNHITNIYERIIVDICFECLTKYSFLEQTQFSVKLSNCKYPLAFFNPPNRLSCTQEFVYNQVKSLFGIDKVCQLPKPMVCIKRKRDFVDEILVQEMIEDDSIWTNFEEEKKEVLDKVSIEILNFLINEAVQDFSNLTI